MDNLIHQTAFFNMTWGNVVMILVACVFLYLTKLCCSSQQEAFRVCNQRTEVCHRTDTHEDQGRQNCWGNVVMILVACVFLYLAIAKEFEPLLLVPIAFGMLLVNIY